MLAKASLKDGESSRHDLQECLYCVVAIKFNSKSDCSIIKSFGAFSQGSRSKSKFRNSLQSDISKTMNRNVTILTIGKLDDESISDVSFFKVSKQKNEISKIGKQQIVHLKFRKLAAKLT